MRQEHRAGEKLFVDYAGQTVGVVDRLTGEEKQAQVFVAVLGCSSYTFAEATWSQRLPDFLGSHVRALEAMGGCPEVVVPDNLRSAVNLPCRYEPEINESYQELARHYGLAVLPARVRKPQDKAKVEVGVQVVERWILACLRHRTFFSLAELNESIALLLQRLNTRPFRKLPGSRLTMFEALDRPALRPLPVQRYEYAEWLKVRPGIDYHVEVAGHYYSVPYTLVRFPLEVRLTQTTVECFHKGKRVSSHARSQAKGRHTTLTEHMPQAHRDYAEWTPERLARWAEQTGPSTRALVEVILKARVHPQHGFRACLGLLRLGKTFGPARLEAACERALTLGASSYRSVKSILASGLDLAPGADADAAPVLDHTNVRGPAYYH